MTTRRALIMGGGLGGPVAAMALERAGIQATVYEATDTPADHGRLFLNTSSNGLDVLRTLGVDTAGQAESFPMPRMAMWSGTGKRLGEVANGIRLPDGTNSVALRRGLLQRSKEAESCTQRNPSLPPTTPGSAPPGRWRRPSTTATPGRPARARRQRRQRRRLTRTLRAIAAPAAHQHAGAR